MEPKYIAFRFGDCTPQSSSSDVRWLDLIRDHDLAKNALAFWESGHTPDQLIGGQHGKESLHKAVTSLGLFVISLRIIGASSGRGQEPVPVYSRGRVLEIARPLRGSGYLGLRWYACLSLVFLPKRIKVSFPKRTISSLFFGVGKGSVRILRDFCFGKPAPGWHKGSHFTTVSLEVKPAIRIGSPHCVDD